ncbi:MAG: 5-formyltetrahydrofolate cyclo-ligase [Polyangiales bacterium]
MSPSPAGGTDDRIRIEVKRELRKRMRAVRGVIPTEACETRSRRIEERVRALPPFTSARTLLSFAPIRKEVRTRAIMQAAWDDGKRVALPRVTGDELELLWVRPETKLIEGAFGVPEPPGDADRVDPGEIEFALVPALAADSRGHRIGYGGGYYDRLLPTMPNAFSCVVAFDFQLIGEVPKLDTDVAAQTVVTDRRVIQVE